MTFPIRILYVSNGLDSGGKERQLIELIKNINIDQHIIGIITFGKDQYYSAEAKRYSSYYKELDKKTNRFKPFFSVWECFREFKPDIVHTWDGFSTMYSLLPCRYYKTKLIDGSIRDAGAYKGWQFFFKWFLLGRSSFVISNSNAGLNAYKKRGIVIYNSIDPTRFISFKENKEFNIVMTANFSDAKDHQTFLKAAIPLVRNKIVDNVYLLGDGPLKERYINSINKEHPDISSKFHFKGNVRNVEEYISECHVGVLCSTIKFSEGISNSVLEYMATGLVPIVTDLGGSSEIIEDGRNGYLIKPEDSGRIIELVLVLKTTPELFRKLSQAARKTIETKFSMKKNIKMLTDIYSTLLN